MEACKKSLPFHKWWWWEKILPAQGFYPNLKGNRTKQKKKKVFSSGMVKRSLDKDMHVAACAQAEF